MDEKDQDFSTINQAPNQTLNCYLKTTLQFLVPISIISFLVSYFSFSPLNLIFHMLQFYSSIYPFLAQALDRKCMFLVCNGILAFLANNLNTSAFNHGGFINPDEGDGDEKIPEMLAFQENAASHVAVQEEKEIPVDQQQDEGVSTEVTSLESEEWEQEEDENDEEEESEGVEESAACVNEMRVSTEELNKKFEEFIRRMKAEIRIEAREQYMIAV